MCVCACALGEAGRVGGRTSWRAGRGKRYRNEWMVMEAVKWGCLVSREVAEGYQWEDRDEGQ